MDEKPVTSMFGAVAESTLTWLGTNGFERPAYCDTNYTGAVAGAGATCTPAHYKETRTSDKESHRTVHGLCAEKGFCSVSGKPAMKLILRLPETYICKQFVI